MRGWPRARSTFLSKIISPELCESCFLPPAARADGQMDPFGPDMSIHIYVSIFRIARDMSRAATTL